jgi:histidine triad (HIT) family protein
MDHENCLFCKIINKNIPSELVYEDDFVIGFRDLHPQAKEHYLFINKIHSDDVNDMMASNPEQITQIYQGIKSFTESNQIDENGFRVVTNLGPNGGQTVFHTHFHLLCGEKLRGFGS